MLNQHKKLSQTDICSKCQEKLDELKTFPCGESICTECIKTFRVNKKLFDCSLSNIKHRIPDIFTDQMKKSQTVQSLKQTLTTMHKNIASLSLSINTEKEKVKNYCSSLRSDVKLATTQCIKQINEHSNQMIREINKFEKDSIQMSQLKKSNRLAANKLAKEMEIFHQKWNNYIKQSKISDHDVSKATEEATALNEKAQQEKLNLDLLILNENWLKFKKNSAKLDKTVLGSLEKTEINLEKIKKFNSSILSTHQIAQLMKLCEFYLDQEWNLIYRATEDGFAATDFHIKCFKKPNTLVIIKSTSGNVFGGYTQKDWSGNVGWKNDDNAFIFSLINKENKPLLMKCLRPNLAIWCQNAFGPIFGGANSDIFICSHSNELEGSYANLGFSYSHPQYAKASSQAQNFLAGSYKFKTVEIEVYMKTILFN